MKVFEKFYYFLLERSSSSSLFTLSVSNEIARSIISLQIHLLFNTVQVKQHEKIFFSIHIGNLQQISHSTIPIKLLCNTTPGTMQRGAKDDEYPTAWNIKTRNYGVPMLTKILSANFVYFLEKTYFLSRFLTLYPHIATFSISLYFSFI